MRGVQSWRVEGMGRIALHWYRRGSEGRGEREERL